MQRVNIVVGRFQPFTAGHYVCVEAAKKLKDLPTVICMINTPESKIDKRHPFTTDLLLYIYNELFSSDPYIEKVVPVKNADIVAIGEELKRYGYEIAAWTCGTDRYPTYAAMAEKYHDRAGLADDFEVIEVKRTDEDISATKARSCLLADDKQAFFSMMPRSVKPSDEFFYSLKEQIDKVYNAQEPEPKKTSRRKLSEQYSLERRVAMLEKLLYRFF
jgi:cytidyltransferase-like protein